MANQLHERFPDHIEAIEVLFKKDATFREICSDYEEASAWLVNFCHTKGMPSKNCDRCRELIGELEDEIIEALRGAGF